MKKKNKAPVRNSRADKEKHPFLFAFIVAGILIATLIILMRAAQTNQDTRGNAAGFPPGTNLESGFRNKFTGETIKMTDSAGNDMGVRYRGGSDSPQAKAYNQVCKNKSLASCFSDWVSSKWLK